MQWNVKSASDVHFSLPLPISFTPPPPHPHRPCILYSITFRGTTPSLKKKKCSVGTSCVRTVHIDCFLVAAFMCVSSFLTRALAVSGSPLCHCCAGYKRGPRTKCWSSLFADVSRRVGISRQTPALSIDLCTATAAVAHLLQ